MVVILLGSDQHRDSVVVLFCSATREGEMAGRRASSMSGRPASPSGSAGYALVHGREVLLRTRVVVARRLYGRNCSAPGMVCDHRDYHQQEMWWPDAARKASGGNALLFCCCCWRQRRRAAPCLLGRPARDDLDRSSERAVPRRYADRQRTRGEEGCWWMVLPFCRTAAHQRGRKTDTSL